MSHRSSRFLEFIAELGRRRVFRTSALYAGLAIVVVEATESLAPALGLPLRTLPLVAWGAILGFPLAVGLAWTYDVTPRGIVRTPPDSDGERRRRALMTRIAFRLTLTGLAAAAVGATTWTVLEPFLPDVRIVSVVPAPELPEGSVLVAPVRLGEGVEPALGERTRLLIVQHLAELRGLLPLDPRRVDDGELEGSSLADEARELGAERVLTASLERAAGDGPEALLLTATLTSVADGEPVRATFEDPGGDVEALVARLVGSLAALPAPPDSTR